MTRLAVAAEGVAFRYERTRRRARSDSRRRSPASGDAHGHRPGINGLDLAVRAGEIVGLLGPNGGGKSTLLRLLATALRPQAGTLLLLGMRTRAPARALRQSIGYAADVPVHLDVLSGRHNAVAFARAAGLPRSVATAAVVTLFDRFELTTDAHRAAGEYSHGMRRKLLLTEALAHVPGLILLDEPTLGLDPPASAALGELLRERAAAGAAVVFATHELDLASRLCDRVVFMVDGRVALDGRPHELLHAIDPGTRIRIALRTPLAAALQLDGMQLVRAGEDVIELRTAAGAAALPDLCATLVRENVQVRTIELREPDLRDVFMTVTGRFWSDAS
ncbi:MAG: ATP-binding cassette domain-containing protein [Longimicrobiales bacterium]